MSGAACEDVAPVTTALPDSMGNAGDSAEPTDAAASADAATPSDGGATPAADSGSANAASAELSVAERESLLFTREEEKLARDVYTQLQSRDHVFDNIAASEQMHMDAVATLLTRYALPDPAKGKSAGSFEDATLQGLYDRLVQEGSASTLAALAVGLEIEELDIHDITAAGADVTHADIQRIYDNLTRGSRNHLRAFYARLRALGGSYEPQYLDSTTFLQIAGSAVESGR